MQEDMQMITGRVGRILFGSPDRRYTVFTLRPERGEAVTVTARLTAPTPGRYVTVTGRLVVHPRYGPQFEAVAIEGGTGADTEGLVRYFRSHLFPGIGNVLARRIVEAFGAEALQVLAQEPERLLEVPGIRERQLERMVASYKENRDVHELYAHLETAGVPGRFAAPIHRLYGEYATDLVRNEPYRLVRDLDGFGFGMADALARRAELDMTAPSRLEAGLEYVLWTATAEGHCCLKEDMLLRRATVLLGLGADLLRPLLGEMVDFGVLPVSMAAGVPYIYHPQVYEAETGAAYHLARLQRRAPAPRILAESSLQAQRIEPSPEQREAMKTVLTAAVTVITGGPGTGKTTLVRGLLSCLQQENLRVVLAAPTGRAAKRLAETTGHRAATIHKLLEAGREEERAVFRRNGDNPLKGDVFIIDEASMLDIFLLYRLLEALPSGARLVLVGDVDQLPSVGPGNVLRDCMAATAIPVVRLRTLFRQEEGSGIVTAAGEVLTGTVPRENDDVVLCECTEEEGREIILNLCRAEDYLTPERQFRCQVLSPMRKGICGTEALNATLQLAANPAAADGEQHIRIGDKVMQIVNNYEKDVYNGDIGTVFAVTKQTVAVDFRERELVYEGLERLELEPAYAMTVHKSQGSEYDTVILALFGSQARMLQRNLLYTAITRAKKRVYIVGERAALAKAVRTQYLQGRLGLLRERLCGEVEDNCMTNFS